MKKKTLALLLAIGMLLSLPMVTTNAQKEKKFRILLNGVDIPLTEYMGLPYIEDSRTLVPIRLISESLGYKVDWNEGEQLVTIKGNLNNVDRNINLTIGKNISVVNGEQKQIDESPNVVAKITKDRTYVPLRFVSENLGATVQYEQTKLEHIIRLTVKGMDDAANFAVHGNGGKGAVFDLNATKKEGFLLRQGETYDTVIDRLNQGFNEAQAGVAPPAGNVSKNWIAPHLSVIYFDPIENYKNYKEPWGFSILAPDSYADKVDNMSYMIELIDDRYVPYEKHMQIIGPNGDYQTLMFPMTPPKWESVSQHLGRKVRTNRFEYDPRFGKWKDVLVTKGLDKLYAPHIGEEIKYRVTFKQGEEKHQYEFTVSYLWAVGQKHQEFLRKNDPETLRDLVGVGMNRVDSRGEMKVPVNNWKQIY